MRESQTPVAVPNWVHLSGGVREAGAAGSCCTQLGTDGLVAASSLRCTQLGTARVWAWKPMGYYFDASGEALTQQQIFTKAVTHG